MANLSSQGSSSQSNNPAGFATYGHIDPAVRQRELLSTGGIAGVGSSTYHDADAEITAELSTIFKKVHNIIKMRQKYMELSLQRDHDNPKDEASWDISSSASGAGMGRGEEKLLGTQGANSVNNSVSNSLVLTQKLSASCVHKAAGKSPETPRKRPRRRKPGQDIGEDFDMDDLAALARAETR